MKKIMYLIPALATSIFLCACGGNEKATTLSDSSAIDTTRVNPYAPIQLEGGLFAFDFNGLYFEVDATNAGRISNFSLNGKNSLSGKEVHPTNWGTSLWPSPQSAWGWPPSKAIDVNAYTGGIKENGSIELVSAQDSLLQIIVTKNYLANPADSSITVTYSITNNAQKAQSLGLWEISRVAPGGLTLYPTGKGKKKNLLAKLTADKDGITWFDYDSSTMNFKDSEVPKLIHDGAEGWLAQVNGALLLIKKFQDISPEKTAPEEGEIEIYANPDKSYIEIEQQGEYTSIDPGATLSWVVKWYLRTLPTTAQAEIGNKELPAYIRSIVK